MFIVYFVLNCFFYGINEKIIWNKIEENLFEIIYFINIGYDVGNF